MLESDRVCVREKKPNADVSAMIIRYHGRMHEVSIIGDEMGMVYTVRQEVAPTSRGNRPPS